MRKRRIARLRCRSSASPNSALRSAQAGFSLLELLVAVALIAVVAALAYGVLFQGLSNFTAESETVEAQSNVRYGLTYLSRQIRKGGTISVDDHDGVTWLNIGNYHYYISRDKVIEQAGDDAANATPLVAGIGSMSVSKNGTQVTITINSQADSRGNTVTETMDIYLRE